MTTLLESPVPALAIGAVAIVAALVVFFSRRTGGALAALVLALAATAGLVLLERLIVTPREEVEDALASVLAAIEANDVDGVVGWIDPQAPDVVADARALGPIVDVERARASGGVTIELLPGGGEATARSRQQIFFSGTLRQGGAPLGYFDEVEIGWINRGDGWRVVDYTAYYQGQPIDAVGSARGNRPVPGR